MIFDEMTPKVNWEINSSVLLANTSKAGSSLVWKEESSSFGDFLKIANAPLIKLGNKPANS